MELCCGINLRIDIYTIRDRLAHHWGVWAASPNLTTNMKRIVQNIDLNCRALIELFLIPLLSRNIPHIHSKVFAWIYFISRHTPTSPWFIDTATGCHFENLLKINNKSPQGVFLDFWNSSHNYFRWRFDIYFKNDGGFL